MENFDVEFIEDYYEIAEALDGMRDYVLEFPSGAIITGPGYNSFTEEFDSSKYLERDPTFHNRVQKARQQGLYPGILDFPHRLTLHAYSLEPFFLYVWDAETEKFTRVQGKFESL